MVGGSILAAAALAMSGCSEAELKRGFLPESSVGATNMTDRIQTLWNGSWIAALAVGVIVWGLILWCVVVYRRRKSDPELPAQVRYNMPIEIFYTIVPVMMVGVLFYYTARDQAVITKTDSNPDVTVQVVGKKWSWDFNYLNHDGTPNVYDTGRQADLTGKSDVEDQVPTLYLPVNESVRFDLFSRDVDHSFWVPAFLFKMDVIPGAPNHFSVTPTKVGTFAGKCAELCGEYHSEMLFQVKVVPAAEYQQHLQQLKAAGQTGSLPITLAGANEIERGQASSVGTEAAAEGSND
jgi:cytochrome c oxidase subunit 2